MSTFRILFAIAFPAVAGGIIFLSAGRWDLPFVWAILGIIVAFILPVVACCDPGMVRERQAPGPGNRDRLTRPLSLPLIVGHWVLVGLDVGRFQWSLVPREAQIAGVVGYVVSLAFVFWAMKANRFYSSVVRIQHDRGHHPITTGPYRLVRHPGYAGSVAGIFSGGLALGSWLAMLPLLVCLVLFVRRTMLEDNMLQRELDGYAEYAQKVRYRLVPGIF